MKASFLAISESDSKILPYSAASSFSTFWQAANKNFQRPSEPLGEFGRVVVCGRERFRGEFFEEDLEGNLESRQGNESKSLLNNQTTGGEKK